MRKLNSNSLEMVKHELMEQCSSLAKSCENFRQNTELEVLQTVAAQLLALRGACEILEINGIVVLLKELEALLEGGAEVLTGNSALADQLAQVVQVMKGYLGYVYKLGYDHPLLLLPEINVVRGLAGKGLLTEAYFLDGYLPDGNIIEFVNEKSEDILLVLRRSRHLFQQGLIHAIRGTGQSGAFRIMSHAVRRIHQTLGDETEKLYWLLVFQVVDAFAKRALSVDKARLRSLMAVERQLRQLVQGSSNLEQCYPVELQRTMMAYLLLAGLQPEPVKKLVKQLGISRCDVTDSQIRSDRAMLGSEGEQSFTDTMSLLRDKIDAIAALIQLFEESKLDDQTRDEFLPLTLSIADICSVSGLAKGANLFGEYARQLQDMRDQPLDKLIAEIIDSVLYLECLLLELQGRAPTVQQLNDINKKACQEIIESNITKHAGAQVVEEAINQLRGIMARLTDMQEGITGFCLDDDFYEVFDTVSGATRMLNLEKASAIAKQCSQYARSGKLLIDIQDQQSMATFADVLVSLEYYLDNCRWDRNFDPAVLDIAEECLEQLR